MASETCQSINIHIILSYFQVFGNNFRCHEQEKRSIRFVSGQNFAVSFKKDDEENEKLGEN